MVTGPPSSSPRPSCLGGAPVPARIARVSSATDARCDGDLRREAVDPQVDPVIELEPGVLAQVLDRALELARVAFGAKGRVSARYR